jgi:hypothetical protein
LRVEGGGEKRRPRFAFRPVVLGVPPCVRPCVATLTQYNQSADQIMGYCENLLRFLRTKKGE